MCARFMDFAVFSDVSRWGVNQQNSCEAATSFAVPGCRGKTHSLLRRIIKCDGGPHTPEENVRVE